MKNSIFSGLKRITTILLLIYYSFGVICLPMGDFSKVGDLSAMYDRCKIEYPDITPADFVFEHLLNLGNIIESFEHHNNTGKKELPHHPYHFHINSLKIVCNVTQLPKIDFKKEEIVVSNFAGLTETFTPSGYSNNVFRPPII